MLLAPILAFAAFLRARRESSAARRGCLAVLAVWFLVVALAQAIFIVVQPFSAENRDSLVATVIGLKWLVLGKTVNVPAALGVLLILFGGAAWAGSFAGGQVARRISNASVPTMALAATLGIVLPVALPHTVDVHSQFVGRYNGAFVTFVLGLVVLVTLVRPASALDWRRSLPASAIGLAAVGAVGWHLVVLHQWNAYLGDVEGLLARSRGYIAWLVATEKVGDDDRLRFTRFSWGWTNPSMSILLAPRGTVSSILDGPPGAWRPFDPQVTATLPLSPLLSYAPYVTALSEASANRE